MQFNGPTYCALNRRGEPYWQIPPLYTPDEAPRSRRGGPGGLPLGAPSLEPAPLPALAPAPPSSQEAATRDLQNYLRLHQHPFWLSIGSELTLLALETGVINHVPFAIFLGKKINLAFNIYIALQLNQNQALQSLYAPDSY